MELSLTKKELRLLCDLVYIGNWVVNSPRGEERIAPYDAIESRVFYAAAKEGMPELADITSYGTIPSQPYVDGGIHEAILDYEDACFFNILAEELARRDLKDKDVDGEDHDELQALIDEYFYEFSLNGIDNVNVRGIGDKSE
ncbi:MAG: hypothetical protein MJ141_00280 [Clostridia bacterium]|nr:hypothetical protein [Clostridia bacterium]